MTESDTKRLDLRGDKFEINREGKKGYKIYIGNMPYYTVESTIKRVFSSCGEIVDINILG